MCTSASLAAVFVAEPAILFVLGTTGGGGAENQCLYLLDALHRRGEDVGLVYFSRGPHHDRFAGLGIPLYQVPARLPVLVEMPWRARRLRQLRGPDHPAVLHTWLYEAHEVGLMAARAWSNTRVVLSHRSSSIYPGAGKHMRVVSLLKGRIDHVVANSEQGGMMVRSALGLDPARVSVIGNGVPPQRISDRRTRAEIRAQLGIGPEVQVVCSVGRIDRQRAKDYPNLMSAMQRVWSELPDAALLVVGPTPDELRAEVGQDLPARCYALGWQEHPAEWMQAADLVAVHSRTEGHSNVADEALLLGVPVATTDVGGHPPLVESAGGRVVPVARGDLLGQAIIELLRVPPDRERMREVATRALSIDAVAASYVELYQRLSAEKRGSRR